MNNNYCGTIGISQQGYQRTSPMEQLVRVTIYAQSDQRNVNGYNHTMRQSYMVIRCYELLTVLCKKQHRDRHIGV